MSTEEPPSSNDPIPTFRPYQPAPPSEPEPVLEPVPVAEPEPLVADPIEAAPIDSEPPPPPASGNRGLKTAIVLLAALSLGLAILAASLSATNRNNKGRTEAVQRAAGAMGSALLTYDYHHLDRTKTIVLRLATGTFRKQYSEAFNGGLDTVLTNTKAVSHVRDVEVFVSDVTANSASAIVVIDTVVSGTAGQNRSLTSYLQLELVHSGDKWLVDGVTNLNLSLPATPGSSSTTTTLPAAPTTTR